MTILTEAMADYLDGALPQDAGAQQRVRCQRAYMAGALEVLARINGGQQSRQELMREVLDYGRTIGTGVETAR